MSQKQEINRFSEEAQKLLDDMNQTEIFELCENSAKLQWPDCNAFTEIGIICCSCGRNLLKYKRSPATTQKANCDFTSIPGFVIEKNSSRGPKHGASEREIMFFKAEGMLKKARQSKHGSHPTILARWYAQKRIPRFIGGAQCWRKRRLCFSIASLLKDITIQLHEVNGYRTPNTKFFV